MKNDLSLLPGLREALKWKPNTPQLENAMTYAWESALKSFIGALEKGQPLATPLSPLAAPILPPMDANGKRARLFYWEETEDAWCPAEGLEVENIIDHQYFVDDGEVLEVRFKIQFMTDAEFAAIPEG